MAASNSATLSLIVNAQNNSGSVMSSIREAFAGIAQSARDAGAAASQAGSAISASVTHGGQGVNELAGRFSLLKENMVEAGIAATAMGAAIVGALGFALKASAEFEHSMAKVKAVLQADLGQGELKAALSNLSTEAKRLGLDTQFSATQAADAMGELAKAGYKTGEIIGATDGILKLAAVSEMGLAQSAEIVVNILNPFGLAASNAASVSNTLAVAANATTSSLSSLAEGMKYVAPVANAVGMSVNETAAALGILSDAGIKGEMSGTALRSLLTSLSATTERGKNALRDMGVEIAKTSTGQLDLVTTMERLKAANMDLYQATKLFGKEFGSAALALANHTEKTREVTEQTFRQTDALDKMKETMTNTAKGALVQLKSSIEGLGIAIGDQLLAPMGAVVKKITEWVNATANWAQANPEVTKTITYIVGALGTLLTILAPLAVGLAGLIRLGVFVKDAFLLLGPVLSVVIGVVKGLAAGVAALSAPWLVVAAAVAAVVAGVTYLFAKWVTGSDKAKESNEALIKTQLDLTKSAVDAGLSWKEFQEQYKAKTGELPTAAMTLEWKRLKAEIQATKDTNAEAMKKMAADTQGGVGALSGTTKLTHEEMEELNKKIKESVSTMKEQVKEGFEALKNSTGETFAGINTNVTRHKETWSDAWAENKNDLTKTATAFTAFAGSFTTGLRGIGSTASQYMGQVEAAIKKAASSGDTKTLEEMREGYRKFAESVVKEYEKIVTESGAAYKKIRDEHAKIVDEMIKNEQKFQDKQLSNADYINEAFAKSRSKDQNDYQKYQTTKAEIAARNKEIEALQATGQEEDYQRAEELIRKNVEAIQSLGQVKMSYYDQLAPRQKEQFDAEMQRLQAMEVKDKATEDRLKQMGLLKSQKAVVVSSDTSTAEREVILAQQKELLENNEIDRQDAITTKLDAQKTALEGQMAEMKKIYDAASAMVDKLRETIKINIDTSDIETKFAKLLEAKTLKINVQYEGSVPKDLTAGDNPKLQYYASGGSVGGSGSGDTVPAMLTPGEWVINVGSVRAATGMFGSGFFGWLNRLGRGGASIAQSAASGVQHFAAGGMVQGLSQGLTDQIARLIAALKEVPSLLPVALENWRQAGVPAESRVALIDVVQQQMQAFKLGINEKTEKAIATGEHSVVKLQEEGKALQAWAAKTAETVVTDYTEGIDKVPTDYRKAEVKHADAAAEAERKESYESQMKAADAMQKAAGTFQENAAKLISSLMEKLQVEVSVVNKSDSAAAIVRY